MYVCIYREREQKRGGEEVMGEWKADSNSVWCSIFLHYSLACQIQLENWRGRKGRALARQGASRSITGLQPCQPFPMKCRCRDEHGGGISSWVYDDDTGLMLCLRILHEGGCRWLQKVSRRVWNRFWKSESLVWIRVLSLSSSVTLAKYLTSLAPRFPYLQNHDAATSFLRGLTWHNNYLIINIS